MEQRHCEVRGRRWVRAQNFVPPCLDVILDPGGRSTEDAVVALVRSDIRW